VASTTDKLLQTWQALCEAAEKLQLTFVKLVSPFEPSADLQWLLLQTTADLAGIMRGSKKTAAYFRKTGFAF
jgi:hypothetical protein